jgi:hypothetical protein
MASAVEPGARPRVAWARIATRVPTGAKEIAVSAPAAEVTATARVNVSAVAPYKALLSR